MLHVIGIISCIRAENWKKKIKCVATQSVNNGWYDCASGIGICLKTY